MGKKFLKGREARKHESLVVLDIRGFPTRTETTVSMTIPHGHRHDGLEMEDIWLKTKK